MITGKSQLVQLPLAVIMFVLVFGALATIWPAIFMLFLGVLLLLLKPFSSELGVAVLP